MPHFRMTFLIAALLAASSLQAGPHGGGGFGPGGGALDGIGGRMAHRFMHIADELELTDAQREQVREIFRASRDQAEVLAMDLASGHRELREMTPENYDAVRVNEVAAIQGDLVAQLIVIKTEARRDMLSVLTPEQRERFEELKPRRRGPR